MNFVLIGFQMNTNQASIVIPFAVQERACLAGPNLDTIPSDLTVYNFTRGPLITLQR